MPYYVHLRLHADLIGVARVVRMLRRHSVRSTDLAIEPVPGRDEASVRGTFALRRRVEALAAALVRTPCVAHAAIFHDSGVLLEFSRGSP